MDTTHAHPRRTSTVRLVDRALHPCRLCAPAEELRRNRVLAGTTGSLLLASFLIVGSMFLPGQSRAFLAPSIMMFVVYGATLAVLRYTVWSWTLPALFVSLGLMIYFAFVALHHGAASFATSPWNVMVLLFASYFAGARPGLLTTGFLVVEVVALNLIDRAGWALPAMQRGDQSSPANLDLLSEVVSIALVGLLSWFYAVSREESQRALREAHAEVQQSETNLVTLIGNTDDRIALVDAAGRLVVANAAFRRAYRERSGREAQRGESIWDPVDSEARRRFGAIVGRVMAGEAVAVEEVVRFGERVEHLALSLRPVPDGHGGVRGYTLFVRDITQQRRLELELRQAQKLESVGRLAAGVAHEINTPVQFVSDSVRFVDEAFTELHGVVLRYEEARALLETRGPVEAAPALQAARAAAEAADLPYIGVEIPRALERSLVGLDRIATIVRSMKEFAHPDHKEMHPVDLNRAIQSTLTIAHTEYRYVAELRTDFAELPQVMCCAGEINQAVLNLLINAAHAIADKIEGTRERGHITVSTRQIGDEVEISIADDGNGIPEEIRERIFDPFFTTKEVGRGTGQGLAIARTSIQERHGGTLRFSSEVGRGTTFRIRLPIEGRPPDVREDTVTALAS